MKENLEFRNLLARWGLGQNKLSSHTTVTDSYEKSFDTHFVSSGLLWQYLVTRSQTKPSPNSTALLCMCFLFNNSFNGNPQAQAALEKARW